MYRIRNARPADAPAIADFLVRLGRETEGLRLDRPTVLRGARAIFRDPARGAYLVAEERGRLLACLLTTPEWSDWRNGTVVWIGSVYVVPEARRRGVFRAMYARLKGRVARSRRLRGLRLYVDKTNRRAHNVYESLGLSREHYHMYEWLK